MSTLILSHRDIAELLTMELSLKAVESAFLAHGRGETRMPPKVYLALPEHDGDFRAMPSTMGSYAGVKWVNAHPQNPHKYGLQTARGVYVLSDPKTANPLAVMDATLITAFRTGAGAGVASKFLAKKAPKTLGLVGCGAQAITLLSAHRLLWPEIAFHCADIATEKAAQFAAKFGGKATSIQGAAECDIVCTATPARTPVIESNWIRPGTHINAMGADGPGKQELESSLLSRALIVIDEPEQAHESGEINVPLHAGAITVDHIHGTLGQVIAGHKTGRTDDQQITLFDSTGLAIQDIALAALLYESARERRIGSEIDLVPGG